jgi:acylphosphatase
LKAYRIFVAGRVQGVGFRRNIQQRAWELGISGQVENLDDGRVQIEAQGEDEKLGEFIGSLNSIELPAIVKDVTKSEIDVQELRVNFKIKHGEIAQELDESLGAGQEQLLLLRKELVQFTTTTGNNFNTLANRYDKISEALTVLTSQTKQFTEALTTLTQLAKEYFDERRNEHSEK